MFLFKTPRFEFAFFFTASFSPFASWLATRRRLTGAASAMGGPRTRGFPTREPIDLVNCDGSNVVFMCNALAFARA
jgi:hypothetical protein